MAPVISLYIQPVLLAEEKGNACLQFWKENFGKDSDCLCCGHVSILKLNTVSGKIFD